MSVVTKSSGRQLPHLRGKFGSQLLLTAVLVFAGYYLSAKLGLALTFKPHPVSILWPPNALLSAALLLSPKRIWPAVLAAAFVAHGIVQLESEIPLRMIVSWFASNSFEAILGASLVRSLNERSPQLDNVWGTMVFCAIIGFFAPFVSSFLDAAFVKLNTWGQGTYWDVWRIRFTSNMLAALMVVPLVLTWAKQGAPEIAAKIQNSVEIALLFSGLTIVCFGVFFHATTGIDAAFLLLPLPFMLWAALRFGSWGAATASSVLSFMVIWSAAHGHGPFSIGTPEQNVLAIQIFLITFCLTFLLLAAVVEERARATSELAESERRYREAAATAVAERVRMENALNERDARISLATESANLALWAYQPETDTIWMSDKGKIIYGFEQSEALSPVSLLSCVHPDDVENIKRAFDPGSFAQSWEIEHRLLRRGGGIRWVITRGRHVVDDKGTLLEIIGVTFDVTAQKEAAAQLQASREEVAHLSRVAMMAEISTSLAHELTQPLAAIMSNAEAGQRMLQVAQHRLHEFHSLLSDIASDASRAGEVVHGIRRMVKKTSRQRTPENLNDVVESTLRILRPEALLNSCELKAKLEPNLPVVEADPVEIQQVLVNLIINSIEATRCKPSNQRKVVITTQRKNETEIEIAVRDSGLGLANEAQAKVFEQFYSTKSEGLGMGLAISRSIVEAHKGMIGAENVQTGGARFYFTLPIT